MIPRTNRSKTEDQRPVTVENAGQDKNAQEVAPTVCTQYQERYE